MRTLPLSVRIKVLGKPAHVGLSASGENAFEQMSRCERPAGTEREVSIEDGLYGRAEQMPNPIMMLGGRERCRHVNFTFSQRQCWFHRRSAASTPERFCAKKPAHRAGPGTSAALDVIPLNGNFSGRSVVCMFGDNNLGRALAQVCGDISCKHRY